MLGEALTAAQLIPNEEAQVGQLLNLVPQLSDSQKNEVLAAHLIKRRVYKIEFCQNAL